MISKVLKGIGVIAIMVTMMSCGGKNSGAKFKAKPSALAKMNEVVIVTDDALWQSMIGDTIEYLFESAYPITPHPEPTFDLRMFTVGQLNARPLRKNLRTYLVVANLADENSEVTQFVKADIGDERYRRAMTDPDFNTSLGKDKWANGQILIYVFANGIEELGDAIAKNYAGIAKRINEHDADQLHEAAYSRGVMQPAIDKISGFSDGATVKIPNDYKIAKEVPEENNLMWFTRDTRRGRMDLVVRVFDYVGPESVSKAEIKKNFNTFGRHVSSDQPNSYMIINDVDLPMMEWETSIDGQYAKEFRGIWELENDFMGGPFLSYVIVNGDKGKYIQVDGFILAQGQDKRDLMQQIDLIAKGVTWQ